MYYVRAIWREGGREFSTAIAFFISISDYAELKAIEHICLSPQWTMWSTACIVLVPTHECVSLHTELLVSPTPRDVKSPSAAKLQSSSLKISILILAFLPVLPDGESTTRGVESKTQN